VPRNGWIVLNGDDANLRALGPLAWTRTVRVGLGEDNDLRLVDFSEAAEGSSFKLVWRGQLWHEVRWSLPGLYNARNAAMAAIAAALMLDSVNPTALRLEALARFRGVKRRQEILLATPRFTVIEDFGHHPTALAETLSSFRARFPEAILTAVFEPRSNTARSQVLQTGFMQALARADEVYLGAVSRAETLKDNERFDTAAVVAYLETKGVTAHAETTNAALLDKLLRNTLVPNSARKPRVVAFFTNGSFDGIIGKYAAAAGKASPGFSGGELTAPNASPTAPGGRL
jgi:UDP-N-acetylmuramate: L-alanyl-gamma-D-glutamyl-meso-diaminopimelate ligase